MRVAQPLRYPSRTAHLFSAQKKPKFFPAFGATVLVLLLSACSRAPSAPDAALKSFSADRLMQHIKTLSSDEFEGRAPGSTGEQLSIRYIQQQFRQAGLEPGNPNGSYLQEVPLVGLTADPKMELAFTGRGRTLKAKFGDNFIAWTKRDVDSVSMDGDLIFVGYGVQAPEYRWDDFKGLDVKGKVLVMLVSNLLSLARRHPAAR
jgi:hypothetical protein